MTKIFLLVLPFFVVGVKVPVAQKVYTIDASDIPHASSTDFKFGDPGPSSKEIKVKARYMTIGGKAVIPVMGEMHYARVPRENWEDAILKMKANGINIIASYIFWIHHEEIEGKFDWEGRKSLRAFAELCQKHEMYFYPRIGPWCHGEVRNGGIPDWVLLKKGIEVRSNDPEYQKLVDRLYKQIGEELKGLMYKSGGPVIGVQLENEYVEGKKGEAHILWLKQTALKYGFDVPLYTVTGWGNASIPKDEVIPLFGAYPDEPWMDNLERNTSCNNFAFSAVRNDAGIGNALQQSEQERNLSAYPYFTCEIGVGIDNTAHRRLMIDGLDGYGLVAAKLGSGSNLIGYYMFAGGLNPPGLLTSMEENALESGGYNTNPAVTYDFQAAIKTSGALSPSYQEIKKVHYFLNEFGSLLAPMDPVFVSTGDDLKLSVRTNGNQAFLFGLNYCRHNTKPAANAVQFTIKLTDESITFPANPVDIPDSSMLIWPVNFQLENVQLKYATAQPLCKMDGNGYGLWIFIQNINNHPEFCFDAAGIDKLSSSSGNVKQQNGKYIVSNIKPGADAVISITPKKGQPQKIIILSKEEAKQAWLLKDNNKKHFFISNANMYLNKGHLHIYGPSTNVHFKTPENKSIQPNHTLKLKERKQGLFTDYSYNAIPQNLKFVWEEEPVFKNAKWLVINSFEKLDKKRVLYHHFFLKEFNFEHLSKIKSAQLIIAAQSGCKVQVNDVWVNQPVSVDQLNEIDLTGYLQKGKNKLLLEFPFSEGKKIFAAKLIIEAYNNNRIELNSDSTWVKKDAYNFPSFLTGEYPTAKSLVAQEPTDLKASIGGYKEYSINIPTHYPANLSNIYLNIFYKGDRGRLYLKDQLIDDNFNNNTYWNIGLYRHGNQAQGKQLKLLLYPLKKEARVYFDLPLPQGSNENPGIKNIEIIPEYFAGFIVR